MTQSTGKISLSLAQADGSTRNVTADISNILESIIAAPKPAFVSIPETAKTVLLDTLTDWNITWDDTTPNAGKDKNGKVTPGAVGTTALAPPGGRAFQIVSKVKGAGVRFSTHFGVDPDAQHFVYDTITTANWSLATRFEIDINQVDKNGKTIMLCQQACAGGSLGNGMMELTFSNAAKSWVPSNVPCDISKWKDGTPHRLRTYATRDANGNVTYVSVEIDNEPFFYAQPAATGPSIKSLGWNAGSLVANWQLEVLAGTFKAVSTTSISRW